MTNKRGRRRARDERGAEHREHRHERHGRSGLGRLFAHGDLRLDILSLIAEKPSRACEIIKAIEERVGGAYSPSPGVIYPTLTLLEDLGYVTVTPDAWRRSYVRISEWVATSDWVVRPCTIDRVRMSTPAVATFPVALNMT